MAQVYDLTCSRVYGAVLAMVQDPGVAGEVTREIYLQIWREACGFDPSRGGGLAWIMALAHNRCVDRVRTLGMDSVGVRYAAAVNGAPVPHRAGAGTAGGTGSEGATVSTVEPAGRWWRLGRRWVG